MKPFLKGKSRVFEVLRKAAFFATLTLGFVSLIFYRDFGQESRAFNNTIDDSHAGDRGIAHADAPASAGDSGGDSGGNNCGSCADGCCGDCGGGDCGGGG